MARQQDVHVGYRIPGGLHSRLLAYAVRHKISSSEAVRRLLESALKTSQRR
jgi:plasmid stability protein